MACRSDSVRPQVPPETRETRSQTDWEAPGEQSSPRKLSWAVRAEPSSLRNLSWEALGEPRSLGNLSWEAPGEPRSLGNLSWGVRGEQGSLRNLGAAPALRGRPRLPVSWTAAAAHASTRRCLGRHWRVRLCVSA